MDRLEAMSIVLAVAETGSLSAAARRLNTPVATASRKITELEEHLHAKLFDRSARKLTLTDSGRSYVAALKRILADLSEADRAAAGEYTKPTGELLVTAPVGLGRLHLMPILAEFLRAYPDIDIRLVLVDRIFSLPEDHFDVALRIGTLPDSRLIALRLATDRSGNPDDRARRVPAADAAGQLRLRRRPLVADQVARLSRFRGAAPQGAAGLIEHFCRIGLSNLRNGFFRFRRLPRRHATHHSLP
jgi:DNA-binding transcriptional LysR family regulator